MKKDSEPVLLDVGVLVALGWSSHPNHTLVMDRMERQNGPWHTCVITQLGFVRLSVNPAVTKSSVTASLASELLMRMMRDRHHSFLSDSIPVESTASMNIFQRVMGPKQVVDAYLLSLAARNGARFLTLDTHLAQVAEGVTDLEVLRAH